MTLGDGKRKVLMLLDEYSSGGVVTNDPDIDAKMADFFDIAQKQVALIKKIVKIYNVPRETGKTRYDMPEDYISAKGIYIDGERTGALRWSGNKLIIPETVTGAVEVEYNASPATITSDTPDDYVFEVAPDAAEAMPYYVASQQLIVDLVVDYRSLLELYNSHLSLIDNGGKTITFKNTLYRR